MTKYNYENLIKRYTLNTLCSSSSVYNSDRGEGRIKILDGICTIFWKNKLLAHQSLKDYMGSSGFIEWDEGNGRWCITFSTEDNKPELFKYSSTEQTVARAMAHDLVQQASAMLAMALRLDGTHPSMNMHAEFQTLDIMRAELDVRITKYRPILCLPN